MLTLLQLAPLRQVHDTVWDTVVVVRRGVPADKYVAALESANTVHGVWWTAMGVLVSALGVLFGAGAVAAAFILWRQSADYKKKEQAALESLDKAREAVLASARGADAQVAAVIRDLQAAAADTEGQQRAQLDALAERLKSETERSAAVREFMDAAERAHPVARPAPDAETYERLGRFLLQAASQGGSSGSPYGPSAELAIVSITDADRRSVDPEAVRGQINVDVWLRLQPGASYERLEVLVDGSAACSQVLRQPEAEQPLLRGSAGSELRVVCAIKTDKVTGTGQPVYANGTHALSARLIGASGSVVASARQTLVFDNIWS